jgi:4-diphosphocytidyl-2-C-methyl-D-erythritol kinase
MSQPETPSAAVRVGAAAKINLYLHVLGKRPDGFHDLDSLVMFADLGDVVTVRPALDPDRTQPGLTLEGPFAPALADEPPESNLVVRAARALAEHLGRPAAVEISVVKNLPVASGIGGGSADAAACLRALLQLWQVEPEPESLNALAARLGADVPVCLAGRATFFGGIGDLLSPAPALPVSDIVLVNPGLGVATPAVFRARRGTFSRPARFAVPPKDAAALADLL